jgi:hypothetical protein
MRPIAKKLLQRESAIPGFQRIRTAAHAIITTCNFIPFPSLYSVKNYGEGIAETSTVL